VGRFEEAIAIIGPLLRGETVTLAGSYYQVRGAVLHPPPDRPIPILVAAKGRRMLRLTARYADAWNTAWFGRPNALLHRRLADLDAALAAEGRDPATLRRTVGMEVRDPQATAAGGNLGEGFGGSVDELARAIDAHERLGLDDLIVQLEPKTMRSLDRLAEALELRAH
jgi:alkanesulfonate monooxygenase SsuD/methylene tetrahydromethanopterin reductase-like flavin-dependent oxidoreductase (luciferase family)